MMERLISKELQENMGYMITDMELGDDMNITIYMYEESSKSYNINIHKNKEI